MQKKEHGSSNGDVRAADYTNRHRDGKNQRFDQFQRDMFFTMFQPLKFGEGGEGGSFVEFDPFDSSAFAWPSLSFPE